MSQPPGPMAGLPTQQQIIRAKCVHPTGTFIGFPAEAVEQSIPALFEQQVARHSTRLAVKSGQQTLTYAALNQRANRVARAIQARCGEGGEPIALLLEQGAPVIAGLLGVLKTGKFYVPLDPSYPPARLTYMLEDSQARLLVTNTQHLPLTKAIGWRGPEVLNLDELDAELSDENLGTALSPDTLAHLLYTSGSTGTPKGVLHNHRNVLHMIKNECNGFHFCTDDRLSLLYSTGVVSSARITLSGLLSGATLFPFNLREQGLARMTNWLIEEEITFYNSVATVFRHFAGSLTGEESFPHLRLIVLGSETVYKSDVELYRRFFPPSCVFVANLGCTEIAHIRMNFIDKEVAIPDGVVPVGYPQEGLQVLLLDEADREVGVGAVGQLAVKSRYVALGYWRRDDLTRARFLPDPDGGGERIYLTGDLVRMHADGCVVHVGREDFQVKIRGFRVEVGEIETALLEHPAVKQAVVVAHDDPHGEKRLAAYLVASPEATVSADELRHALADKLPEYMLPTAFVFLEALPVTATGKLDRLALPVPERLRPELANAFVAPHDAFERQLTDIWEDLLGLKPIGVQDDFFELGGHSLLAVKLFALIEKQMGIRLPLEFFFESPTIAYLAHLLRHQGKPVPKALPVEPSSAQAASDRIAHPIARHLPAKYHPYVKNAYRQLKHSPLGRVLGGMYVRQRKKIVKRYFSYTPAQLEQQLKHMGIAAGDTVLMHSAFRVFNGFQGTPDQVIECVLNVVGQSGNLLMVSMPSGGSTYDYLKAGIPFDVNNTTSAMGVIAETFRRRPGVVRSLNPAHPILAYGPAAQWIISDHEKMMYSCGKGSPFEKILQLNAKGLFFDVSLGRMTFFHYLEDRFKETLPVKLYEEAPLESIVIDANGNEKIVKSYIFSQEARKYRSNRDLLQEVIKDKGMKTGKIGRTKLIVLDLNHVVECAQKMISSGKPLWKI
jgi:amino acid adenylation domain-containing protein